MNIYCSLFDQIVVRTGGSCAFELETKKTFMEDLRGYIYFQNYFEIKC